MQRAGRGDALGLTSEETTNDIGIDIDIDIGIGIGVGVGMIICEIPSKSP